MGVPMWTAHSEKDPITQYTTNMHVSFSRSRISLNRPDGT